MVWLVTSHVVAVRDPKTGHNSEEVTRSEKRVPCEHEKYCELVTKPEEA
jgi:hypothetical protein